LNCKCRKRYLESKEYLNDPQYQSHFCISNLSESD